MDTIALWEQEIEESSKSHFFEDTERAINYLSESIELDIKLSEMGILTEADDENNKIGPAAKFAMIIAKIRVAITTLKKKIINFIKDKIQDFRQKRIVEKFKSGKIDPEKMAKRLNRTKLFNPKEIEDFFKTSLNIIKATAENIDDKYVEKMSKISADLIALNRASDIAKEGKGLAGGNDIKDLIFVKIDPKNAQTELVKLYDETEKALNRFASYMDDIDKQAKSYEAKLKNAGEDDNKESLKANMSLYKNMYTCAQAASKLLIRQGVTLEGIMIGFTKGEENNKEDNS